MSAAERMRAVSPSASANTWYASCTAASASTSRPPAPASRWPRLATRCSPSMAAPHTFTVMARRRPRSFSRRRPTSPLTADRIISSTFSCCASAAMDSRRPSSTSSVSSSAVSSDTACGKAYSSTLAPVLPMSEFTRSSPPSSMWNPMPASQGWMSGPPAAPVKPASSSSSALRRAGQGPSSAPPLPFSRRRRWPSAAVLV
mmetsp:Transcript_36144/g.91213  ORF Transcript_36144/g.91213 Transcript_36144/m.91213 type:complete len:201 (-) Transcript_36144:480-1082(-)